MAGIPGFLLRHVATIEPYLGTGPFGDLYGPAVEVRCFVDDTRRRVRTDTGDQVVSGATAYLPLDVDCPTGSRVTVNARPAVALTSHRRDSAGLPTPDHLEVALT